MRKAMGSKRLGLRDISDPGNGIFRTKNDFFSRCEKKKNVRVGPFLTGRVG